MTVWKNGFWWPLFDGDWDPSKVSENTFDPRSINHIIFGIIIQLMIGNVVPFYTGLPIALLVNFMGRFLENVSEEEEKKETIQHVVGCLFCCFIGYTLSALFCFFGVWWLGIIVIFLSEIIGLIIMRETLSLFLIMKIKEIELIKKWQKEGIKSEES